MSVAVGLFRRRTSGLTARAVPVGDCVYQDTGSASPHSTSSPWASWLCKSRRGKPGQLSSWGEGNVSALLKGSASSSRGCTGVHQQEVGSFCSRADGCMWLMTRQQSLKRILFHFMQPACLSFHERHRNAFLKKPPNLLSFSFGCSFALFWQANKHIKKLKCWLFKMRFQFSSG